MGTKNDPGPFDCYVEADGDEPLFVLRAKDPLAADLVRLWVTMRRMTRRPWTTREEAKTVEAMGCADAMTGWRIRNTKR